jgi:putative glutathione S-transferase
MGKLINGKWHDQWYDTESNKGEFIRESSPIHNWITLDGSAGPSGVGGFKAESGRYHLYVSLACPWAHRTLIFRKLKSLEKLISVSVVSPHMLENGWSFAVNEGSTGDSVNHFDYLYQVYTANDPHYTGRVTVPVLWDKQKNTIVNNDSSKIIRMFNNVFDKITNNHDDYYPASLQNIINQINEFIYENINNGVYKCGFATTQEAYEKAYLNLFDALDKTEDILSKNRYLTGSSITEADWRFFTTLIRFDVVYNGHFKCIEDYPNLSEYVRELYQWPGISETVDFYHIKQHYYFSHKMINPTQIVPLGPEINYARPFVR